MNYYNRGTKFLSLAKVNKTRHDIFKVMLFIVGRVLYCIVLYYIEDTLS